MRGPTSAGGTGGGEKRAFWGHLPAQKSKETENSEKSEFETNLSGCLEYLFKIKTESYFFVTLCI